MIDLRIGHGYDVHRLVEGRPLILGGVTIPYERGLLGHSDADVLAHAVMDALLGAAGCGQPAPSGTGGGAVGGDRLGGRQRGRYGAGPGPEAGSLYSGDAAADGKRYGHRCGAGVR